MGMLFLKVLTLKILTGFTSCSILLLLVSYFFYHCQSLSCSFCKVYDGLSPNSNKNDVFSIHPSSFVFIFQDFNIHHKDLINFSVELIELINFVLTFNQPQVVLIKWSINLPPSEAVISTALPLSSWTLIHTCFYLLFLLIHSIGINSFICTDRIWRKKKRKNFRQATNCWKSVPEVAKLAYANKIEKSITLKRKWLQLDSNPQPLSS